MKRGGVLTQSFSYLLSLNLRLGVRPFENRE